jgi:hypothetical protein
LSHTYLVVFHPITFLEMVGDNVPRITCLDFELQLISFFSFGSVGALFGIT